MYFASDNSAGTHPKVMEALAKANEGYASSYGADDIMEGVRQKVRDLFEAPDAEVYLVINGTSANSLSLALTTQPWQTVFCHESSHAQTDECNAPEFFTGGAKMTAIAGENGKITPAALQGAVDATVQGDVHCAQRGALTVTNLTEAGTLYSPAELAALGQIAKQNGMPFHLDGARFSNAIVAARCTPAEMTWKAGVDVLSFGGTKNGLMGVEAVVLFDPTKAWEFELRRKRAGHLLSKHRYLSAQFDAFLTNDLWRDMAANANQQAARLAQGIQASANGALVHPVEGNIVFATMPRAVHRHAMANGAKYYLTDFHETTDGPDEDILPARMVCSWATTNEDVDRFLELI